MSSGISWTDKGDIELLLYIWQSLISFTRAMANTSIHQNEFSSFIAAFFSAIDALLKEPSVDITMLFVSFSKS